MTNTEIMMEKFSKFYGELKDCKTQEDKNNWYSSFGIFVLGWNEHIDFLETNQK